MNKTTNNFKKSSIIIIAMAMAVSCSHDKEDKPMGDQELSKSEVKNVLDGADITRYADIS